MRTFQFQTFIFTIFIGVVLPIQCFSYDNAYQLGHLNFDNNANNNSHQNVNSFITPRVYANYDQTMNWGGSVVLFPINLGLTNPVLDFGVAKNGWFAGAGMYVGNVSALDSISGYAFIETARIWQQDNFNKLPNGWYVNPKIGIDMTCINLEVNHYASDTDAKTQLGIKFRMTEYCAEMFAYFIQGL